MTTHARDAWRGSTSLKKRGGQWPPLLSHGYFLRPPKMPRPSRPPWFLSSDPPLRPLVSPPVNPLKPVGPEVALASPLTTVLSACVTGCSGPVVTAAVTPVPTVDTAPPTVPTTLPTPAVTGLSGANGPLPMLATGAPPPARP